MPLRCEIVTQDRLLYEGPADMVLAPGSEGELGILPNHAPLLTTLRLGVLTVRNGEEVEVFTVAGGVMEVQPHLVTILADVAEHVADIDVQRAERARQRAEQMLAKGPPPDTDEYLAIQAALQRSRLRLEVARRHRRGAPRREEPREAD